MKSHEIYNQLICKVNTRFGAPMGRRNRGSEPLTVTKGPAGRIFKSQQTKVFDRIVYLDSGGYDKGGAYWGIGDTLRVRFTPDLSFVEFYRVSPGLKKAHPSKNYLLEGVTNQAN